MSKSKSEWVPLSLDSERHKAACMSWLSPFCDGMEPTKAEMLIDYETDAEKKLRVHLRGKNGETQIAIRARTKSGFTLTLKPVKP